MNILQIDSSLNGTDGNSSRLAAALVALLQEQHPGATLVQRDLAAQPVPHLDAATFAAGRKQENERTSEEQGLLAEADQLIRELQAADILVLGVPMYNFGIPSTLKAWIDHVARAGVTFRYTANGPEGLLKGKQAWVLAARGGRYAGSDADTQTAYLRTFLGFLGISEVSFLYAEGLASSQADPDSLLQAALEEGRRLLAA